MMEGSELREDWEPEGDLPVTIGDKWNKRSRVCSPSPFGKKIVICCKGRPSSIALRILYLKGGTPPLRTKFLARKELWI